MNEQALKERLKHIARDQKRSFQEIWKLLLLERFLVRLSHSKYQNKLIFKGGLLLSYYLVIARETIDIDFLAKQLRAELLDIKNMLVEICNTEMHDGFILSSESIAELDHSHMNYPGFRAKLNVQFGRMKDRIQVDIGVGDIVEPKQISWPSYQYKGKPIFEESILLRVYPVETIFSEKLETIVSRGSTNSRMKDFHDLLLLCRNDELIDIELLKDNLNRTFQNRNTKLEIPIRFTDDEYTQMQNLWSSHLRTLSDDTMKTLNLPDDISELMKEINSWSEWASLTDRQGN